jgi:hypothetical protein
MRRAQIWGVSQKNPPLHSFTEPNLVAGLGGGPAVDGVLEDVPGSVPAGGEFGTVIGIFGMSEFLRVAVGCSDLSDSIVGVRLSDFHDRCTFGACMCSGLSSIVGLCPFSGTVDPGLLSGTVAPCNFDIRSLALRAASCANFFALASCSSASFIAFLNSGSSIQGISECGTKSRN